MNKFDWDKFKNEKIAVNCRTEEAAKEFIEECYIRGLKWMNGSRNITFYNCYKEETAYTFNFKGTGFIGYSYTHWYKKEGYEIVEYEKQTEFTFQEVIARNIPGVYVCTDKGLRIEYVVINENGGVSIKANYSNLINSTIAIPGYARFKFQEPKKQYTLFEVIHAVGGKHYTFRASDNENLKPRDFVICDTPMGKTFGRVAGSITKELTEKEYLEYKECWRA
ncbi:hypothetical protein [Clostridium culturomicium]|uniref:hypothetical protein n=1 Tax=Clostridium culturomicium TaxID=1499683 RepID=UPI0006946077|nr:hypothetical protein [Clostridium culturomicium]